MEISRQVHGT